MKKILVILFMLLGLGMGMVVTDAYLWWSSPPEPIPRVVEYDVVEGAALSKVAQDLEKLGVLRRPLYLRIYSRFAEQSKKIKAGTYNFDANSRPLELLEKMIRGDVVTIQFVIPEGFNRYQIADKLAQIFPHFSKSMWLTEMTQLKHLETLPRGAKSVEGFLYPETYTVRPKATLPEILRTMTAMFNKHFSPELAQAGKNLGLNPMQIVTLASIIEKETGRPEERARISSVFHNRLKKNMRLQTDPTVIYGMWEKYDGNIHKKDLQTVTPYNTYTNFGLPPGPIASPGNDSIYAAVHPLITEDIYFVGKGDGTHFFSTNLADHNKAVLEYQIKPYRKAHATKLK